MLVHDHNGRKQTGMVLGQQLRTLYHDPQRAVRERERATRPGMGF